MGFYRKKPVVIEAFKWTGDKDQTEDPVWIVEAIKDKRVWFENEGTPDVKMVIKTLEGNLSASRGDMILKGVKGELYACKPDIFDMTYEEVRPSEMIDEAFTKAGHKKLVSGVTSVPVSSKEDIALGGQRTEAQNELMRKIAHAFEVPPDFLNIDDADPVEAEKFFRFMKRNLRRQVRQSRVRKFKKFFTNMFRTKKGDK